MSRSLSEDLRNVAKTYSELRLQTELNTRRMRECSKTLFKAFLSYVESRRSESQAVQNLLHAFFTEELGLNGEQNGSIRISLARRFYALASRRSRNPVVQASLLQYFEEKP